MMESIIPWLCAGLGLLVAFGLVCFVQLWRADTRIQKDIEISREGGFEDQ